ncbi:hypothetical protein EYF80_014635 [Liparis tanakae]|uniref:Uncharacterized protein n=1 Tax=Liparis tanakae TaxID=230148 RepID=A0A4Z2ICK4_9TELE|nr:hypothetical protein EYF80_014635 [Liparis tanakae]
MDNHAASHFFYPAKHTVCNGTSETHIDAARPSVCDSSRRNAVLRAPSETPVEAGLCQVFALPPVGPWTGCVPLWSRRNRNVHTSRFTLHTSDPILSERVACDKNTPQETKRSIFYLPSPCVFNIGRF